MKVWTSVDHAGVWTVPTASVVVAETEDQARTLLETALSAIGLMGHGFSLQPLDLANAGVTILSDGEY